MSSWVRPHFAEQLRTHLPFRTEQLIASIIGAAAAVIFFWLVLSQFQSLAIALASTFIFALCTSVWSTATRWLWQHDPLVLMLVIAMLLLERARRRPELIHLPLAMGYLIRPTAIAPVAVLSTYVLVCHRLVRKGFMLALRDRQQRTLNIAYCASSMWWGGHSLGPRFTTDIVPFLTYFTAFNFRLPATFSRSAQTAISACIAVLAVVSLLIHSQGARRVETWRWNVIPNNIDRNTSRAWDWSDPQFARAYNRPH